MKLLIVDGPPSPHVLDELRFLNNFGFALVSVGEVIRELLKAETALGQRLKYYVDKEELIPDKEILEALNPYFVVSSKLVLLGFPRTEEQLQNLLSYTQVDAYVCIELMDEAHKNLAIEEWEKPIMTSKLKNCYTITYRKETLEKQVLHIVDEYLEVN